jgi:hypothetical protein
VAAGTRRHVPRGAGHGKLVVCSRSC